VPSAARGLLATQETLGWELLDAGASRAFAVADHQVAHVYVRDPKDLGRARAALEALAGVEELLDEEGKRAVGLDHPRAGELVAVAAPDAWFTYYYWLDDTRAPDFAPTVDIHRKPGYDPAELFLADEGLRTKLHIGWRLAQKALGFRSLMDVIPLSGDRVRGSHGRPAGLARPRPGGDRLGAGARAGGGGRDDRRLRPHPPTPRVLTEAPVTRTTIGLLLLTGLAVIVAISAIVFDFTPTAPLQPDLARARPVPRLPLGGPDGA